MEYYKLKTGVSYTLNDLFSKDNKIIIPDLQRDYCWDATNKDGIELVSKFVENLIVDGFNKDKTKLSLGLIYGYEAPLGHIQLCDGQQRITSLFLLLGMINRKTNDAFLKQLISLNELNDDQEPYLQYAIRESSLYFLSDLVMNFFRPSNIILADIKKQPWYFDDYNLDPTIQSMLSAMQIIENKLETIDNLKDFGTYLIYDLSFLYFDMQNRRDGEQTFVIINTTGEPLSVTENLKPKLIGNQPQDQQVECSNQWENWETYFWQHRRGDNDTSDNGLKEFFRWIMLLNTTDKNIFKEMQETGRYQFDIEHNTFDSIQRYFEIIEYLFDNSDFFNNQSDWLSPDSKDKYRNAQIVWFQLLPVIEYIKRFGSDNKRDVIRIKNFFGNLARIANVSKNISDLLPEAIRIIKELPNKDIISVLEMENISNSLLTEEEKEKFELYKKAQNREQLENLFWKAECHDIFSGEISPLLQWSKNKNDIFSIERFTSYYDLFCKLFYDNELDITRRALLTRGLTGYPRIFNGYTNYSFCWEYSDWQMLIQDNVDKFGLFMQELLRNEDIYAIQKNMITNNPDSSDYDEFVKIPELLNYCTEKNIQWISDEQGWLLLQGKRANGPHANLKSYRLYLDLKVKYEKNWELNFYYQENTCAYFDWNEKQVAIDIYHSGNEHYTLELFRREEGEVKSFFAKIVDPLKLTFNGERYVSTPKSHDEMILYIKQVMNEVEGL